MVATAIGLWNSQQMQNFPDQFYNFPISRSSDDLQPPSQPFSSPKYFLICFQQVNF